MCVCGILWHPQNNWKRTGISVSDTAGILSSITLDIFLWSTFELITLIQQTWLVQVLFFSFKKKYFVFFEIEKCFPLNSSSFYLRYINHARSMSVASSRIWKWDWDEVMTHVMWVCHAQGCCKTDDDPLFGHGRHLVKKENLQMQTEMK